MRVPLALLCLPSLALAAPALAEVIPGQLFLNFDECKPGQSARNMNVDATNTTDPCSGVKNRDLDCASTTATTVLCATARPGIDVNGVLADLGYIDVVVGTAPATLPPFWQFQTGGCAGSGRIVFSADFTANNICTDIWRGLGATFGQWGGATGPLPDGNRARVKWTTQVTPEQAFTIPAGQESYIERITLHQAPEATCGGCATPACAVYLSEGLYFVAGGSFEISGGSYGSEWLTFNATITPTRSSTWGQVKSLYR